MSICHVMCAGDLTVSEINKEAEDLLIAADGGYDYCMLLGVTPDIIIGDFDSVSEDGLNEMEKITGAEIIRLPKEKDDTDTLAALKVGLSKGYRKFNIYGATGGRLEHTIANMQCLLFLKEHEATGYLCDGTGLIFAIREESVSFRKEMSGFLSLFSAGEKAQGVTIEGMKYTMKNGEITNTFPIGISNEFIGEQGSISVNKGALFGIISY